jgi:hypothetical protein
MIYDGETFLMSCKDKPEATKVVRRMKDLDRYGGWKRNYHVYKR